MSVLNQNVKKKCLFLMVQIGISFVRWFGKILDKVLG